ncbi:beta/gamma crystallin family protein [Hyphomonas sp. WL0036]|uniref:beta/gamma crystallin-related protein n=1 Tax=Hyphomonas sediminis TaxID=2866160 RepID=UPI001C7F1DB8|nr:beta/gamma crystallin-related protein [Hyphomonas sediminis]MBY9065970.1 beta/gamma crystallin family protein [Hyphomonas sediminis]
MLTRALSSLLPRLLLVAGLSAAAFAPAALAQRGGSSLPKGSPGIVFYADTNLRGTAMALTSDQPSFSSVRFNDKARSVEVTGGVWLVCQDGGYKGKCEYVDRTVRNLGEIGLSGAISSAKLVPYDKGPRSYDIAFFADNNFGGEFVGFDQGEASLGRFRFNDRASSVMINRGAWLVCEHADYRGQCELLDASTGNLGALGLNDTITSFRRYDVRREGPWRRPVTSPPGSIRDTRGGFEGETSVFFPAPTEYGRRITNDSGSATRFCQSRGFREASYKASGPVLSDVICR